MKKAILLLTLFGLLYADASMANPKKKSLKRKITRVHYGYKHPKLYLSPTASDITNSTDNSGIGKNSSDNYSGPMNNGSMNSNGTYQNSGVISKRK
jgi:hypothetical protein